MTTQGERRRAEPAPCDAVVIGAGISGLVSASVLADQGASRVVVVDGYDEVGGNHIHHQVSTADGDRYSFDIGSLIFQDDSPLVDRFPEILHRYTPIRPTWSRINPQGRVTDYPFSLRDDILAAGPTEVIQLLASAAFARLRRRPQRTARDFAEHWLGPRFVRRSGLGSYMERFCGVSSERIDIEFAHSRMMWIPERARLGRILSAAVPRVRTPPPRPSNTQLARPVEGFDALYAPLVARLEERGVEFVLGVDLRSLTRVEANFVLDTSAGEVIARRVVSTVPIDVTLDLARLRGRTPRLPTVTLVSLYFSFAGSRGFESSVLYNFSHDGTWKRLTVYSDFYGPAASGREYFGVEVVADDLSGTAGDYAEAFRQHTHRNGLFLGDLRLEGSHRLENAYPIYTAGSGDAARSAMRLLREAGIESHGRQGAFQYQPTARASTLEAEAALAVPTELVPPG